MTFERRFDAMTQEHEDGTSKTRVTGTVKWFDPVKGFGFVVSDEGGVHLVFFLVSISFFFVVFFCAFFESLLQE